MLRKILITLPMLFGLVFGFISLFSAARIGDILGVAGTNPAGIGAVSGDFAGFFLVGAGAAALALFKNRSSLLWVPISLYGLAIVGRLTSLPVTGVSGDVLQPIIIEAILVAMLFTALKLSPDA